MNTKYKVLPQLPYLIFTLLSFVFLILACWCLIFVPSFSISISHFFLFLSISILLAFFGSGQEIKYVEIVAGKLNIRHILGFAHSKYPISEIVGFKTAILKKKKGECLQLLIKISNDRVIEINGFLISNIIEIEREIKNNIPYDNSIQEPIVNIKDQLFISFTVSLLISFLWFIISLL